MRGQSRLEDEQESRAIEYEMFHQSPNDKRHSTRQSALSQGASTTTSFGRWLSVSALYSASVVQKKLACSRMPPF